VQFVNEEGLPIIEITEPIPQSQSEKDDNQQQSIIHDVPLIRLSSLPSRARENLRRHSDRILDALEEEERQENERQKRVEREEREEILRKRKQEAGNEEVRLQKAKELQKKMGKALLRDMDYLEEEADSRRESRPATHEGSQSVADTDVHKKTVTFVESSDSVSNASKPDWGDVTAAVLRGGQRPTLLRSFRPDSNPVKLNVVERKPAAPASTAPNRPTPFSQSTKDSDDESEPEDNQLNPPSDDGGESDELAEELPDSEEDDGEFEFENEYDLGYAQHQRQIALEYYNKRNTIGQDAAMATMNHFHEEENVSRQLYHDSLDSPSSDQEPTPEVAAPNNQSKPSVSHFKANRIASAYRAATRANPSTSIGESVLPESTARTIQHAIHSGRIDDDNRLVGGDHESDSEIEAEGLQETLELLRKGEVYNLGPDGHYLYASPQPQPNNSSGTSEMASLDISAAAASSPVAQQQGSHQRTLPPLNRPKISKFKADRSQSGRPSTIPRSESSTPPTPTTHTSRSSPKLPPAVVDTVTEKKPQSTNASGGTRPSSSPMITDSPSFGAPGTTGSEFTAPAQPFTSMIIESPSFPNRSRPPTQAPTAQSNRPALTPSMIVESPSFPPPGQRSRRPERPPTVIPSQSPASEAPVNPILAERPSTGSSSSKHISGKISRFKQSRNTQP
jgi:hypothetical protein